MHSRFLVNLVSSLIFFLGFFSIASVFASSSKLVGQKLGFEHYNITTPFKVSLPVVPVDIVAESIGDELVIIGEDESNQTWLGVYAFDEKVNRFALLDKILLTDEYFAFDVSENGEGLYFLAKNKVVLLQYNSDSSEMESLKSGLYLEQKQKVNSIFLLNEANYISKKDFLQDVNNDGLDDIVLPDFEQTNLWISSKSGQSYSYQYLEIPSQAELSRGGVIFKPITLFYGDFSLDKRQDIAWISQGKINYFSQNVEGEYSPSYNKINLAESIYGLNWWDIRESDGQSPDQSNLTHRVVEEIKDINGDGLADVIVRFTQSSGVLDRVNDYEFYLGNINQDGQLEFPLTPSTVIKAEGTLTGLKIIDVNGDKQFEVLLSSFELSLSNIIGALLSGGIDQNVLLFSLNDENNYDEEPLISKEVELNFSLSSGQSGQPIVLLSDVNGDESQDLVLSSGEEKLTIYLGNKSSGLFNRKGSKHKILLPKNGDLFEHHDVNHDGKEDFIMRYGRLDNESMANKVTILMVK